MRWNRFHISVSLSIPHSFKHSNSSSTCTSCCLSSSLNNFPCSFTCHGGTSTSYLRTSIRSHHGSPSSTKPGINAQRPLNDIRRINQCPFTINKQDNHT